MTNWTDLIDTDPVAAYHAWKKVVLPYDYDEYQYDMDVERLMSNLAALCEHLLAALSEAEEAIDES